MIYLIYHGYRKKKALNILANQIECPGDTKSVHVSVVKLKVKLMTISMTMVKHGRSPISMTISTTISRIKTMVIAMTKSMMKTMVIAKVKTMVIAKLTPMTIPMVKPMVNPTVKPMVIPIAMLILLLM